MAVVSLDNWYGRPAEVLNFFGPKYKPYSALLAYAFLFRTVWQVGTDGGGWLYYLSSTALGILLIGFERLWLCVALSASSFATMLKPGSEERPQS